MGFIKTKNGILNKRVNGIIQMLVSFIFFLYHADTLYAYKFVLAQYFFMYPDWVLITNMIFGILGFIFGLKTYKNQISIKQGYKWLLSIIVAGSLLDILSVL